jgi:hypothetical protein
MRRETLQDPPLFAIAWQPKGSKAIAFWLNPWRKDEHPPSNSDPANAKRFATVADAVGYIESVKAERGESMSDLWDSLHVVGLLPERDGGAAQKGEHAEAGETEATPEGRATGCFGLPSGASRPLGPSGPEHRCGVPGVPGKYQPPLVPLGPSGPEKRCGVPGVPGDYQPSFAKGAEPLAGQPSTSSPEPPAKALGNLPILAPPIQRVSKTSPEGARFGLGQYGYTKYGAPSSAPAGPMNMGGSCGPGGCCPR